MAHRIRVLLLIPHLGGGGAEQVIALLARGLSREKYELHLGLVTQKATPRGDLPAWVTIHALGARRVRAGGWRVLRLVRKVRPDIVLSGMFHLNFLVLLLQPFVPRGTRLLIRQNGTVSAALAAGGLPRGTRFLYRVLYRRAARVICSSRAMADDLFTSIDLPPGHAAVLPNPLDVEAILAARQHPVRWQGLGPHLLAVGRLAPEKGFDLLLEAFARVRERFAAADLVIAGSGPEQAALQAQCSRLGLEQAVHFAGYVANPYALFPGSTLFVLSSRHEGMPNALLEAVAGGLPAVAFPASGGVVEFLQDRAAAWLAPEISAPALAATLVSALEALEAGRQTCLASTSTDAPIESNPLPASHSAGSCTWLGSSSAIAAYEQLIDSSYAARQT
jgi:glycosyltransferase involved in cell wall biosynthesis